VGYVIALLFSVVGAVVALIDNSDLAGITAFGIFLTTVEIFVLTKSAGGFTSTVIPIFAVNGVLLSAPLFWERVQDGAIVSLRRFPINDDFLAQAAIIAIVFSASYTVGALLGRPRRLAFSVAHLGLAKQFTVPDGILIFAGYCGIAISVYGYQGALLQGYYLESRGPIWAVMASAAGIPLSMLLLSIVAVKPGPWRAAAIIGLVVVTTISFGRASRALAMLPALMLFATTFVNGKPSLRYIASAVIATIGFLVLPLAGRNNAFGVGIIPLSEQLFTRPGELLNAFTVTGLAGNVIVSGPQTIAVANRPISMHSYWVSVNPLPGSIAGWNEIKDLLRFNVYTPYNTLGELAAQGWIILALTAAAAGFLFALSTGIASKLQTGFQIAASLLVLAVAVRFSLSILQYNLRTSARLLWWMLLALAAIWAAAAVLAHRSPKTTRSKEYAAPDNVLNTGNATRPTEVAAPADSGTSHPIRPTLVSQIGK